jgi:hypothetical protein
MSDSSYKDCLLKEACPNKQASPSSLKHKVPCFINSREDCYCFWKYLKRVSDPEGFIAPLENHKIAELLHIPKDSVDSILKESLEKLYKILK